MAKANVVLVNVNRAFEKRASKDGTQPGFRVGNIESTWEVGAVTINGQEVSAKGVEHLLNFAFQSLQDAYAGSENETDATEAFAGKLARIIEGSIGVRAAGDGVSAVQAEIRSLIRGDVKKAFDAANGKDAWKGLEEKARVEVIDGVFESQPDEVKTALNAAATEAVERKRAEAAARANAVSGAGIKITL